MLRNPDGGATLKVTDCCSLQSDTYSIDAYPVGNGWGLRRTLFIDGGVLGEISMMRSQILQPKNPRVLVVGDELVEARTLTEQGQDATLRFAALMRQELGGNCFINARSGATAQMVAGWFDSYLSAACQPDYAVIAVGCSDEQFDPWLAGMQTILEKVEAMGATPVLMTLPAGPGSNKHIFEKQNAWIRGSGYAYIDANAVTSLYFEGDSPDPWLYLDDGTHLNVRGHKQVFLRAKLDVPEMMG
jgi:lysophospholipase L1-like esterase